MSTVADPQLEQVRWDLDPLVEGRGEEAVDELLDQATERATAFAERHKGKLAEFDPERLAGAMHELEEIHDLAGRAGSYAMLRFSIDTQDPKVGALVQRVRERGTVIETTLLFFELEWAALEDERADELLAGDGLDFCRHYLKTLRRYRPHLLSEPEEKILSEKSVTGSGAWRRLFTEQASAV